VVAPGEANGEQLAASERPAAGAQAQAAPPEPESGVAPPGQIPAVPEATAVGRAWTTTAAAPVAVPEQCASETAVTVYVVDPAGEIRLTCDVDLSCRAGARTVSGLAEHALVEAKTGRASAALDHAFHAVGVRSVSLSKYCVAVAMLRDGVRTNPWHRVLRRYFAPDPPASG